jgi:hypothetical protein
MCCAPVSTMCCAPYRCKPCVSRPTGVDPVLRALAIVTVPALQLLSYLSQPTPAPAQSSCLGRLRSETGTPDLMQELYPWAGSHSIKFQPGCHGHRSTRLHCSGVCCQQDVERLKLLEAPSCPYVLSFRTRVITFSSSSTPIPSFRLLSFVARHATIAIVNGPMQPRFSATRLATVVTESPNLSCHPTSHIENEMRISHMLLDKLLCHKTSISTCFSLLTNASWYCFSDSIRPQRFSMGIKKNIVSS